LVVDTAGLRQAARAIDCAADDVGNAGKAADAGLPARSFGVLCMPLLAPGYAGAQWGFDALAGALESALGRVAAGARQAADAFDETEQGIAQSLRRLGGGLS